MQFYHIETGEVFTHVRNHGPWKVLEALLTNERVYVSPEFDQYYKPLYKH